MTDASPEIVSSIVGFVGRRFPATSVALGAATPLIDGGTLDSLGVLELMTFLMETYGIEIDADDFSVENLATVETLAHLVERKRNPA